MSNTDKFSYTKHLRTASGQFCTDYLPDNWETLGENEGDDYFGEDDAQYLWLEDHAWEPFENYRGKDIFEMIDNAAQSIADAYYRKNGCPHCHKDINS